MPLRFRAAALVEQERVHLRVSRDVTVREFRSGGEQRVDHGDIAIRIASVRRRPEGLAEDCPAIGILLLEGRPVGEQRFRRLEVAPMTAMCAGV